MQNTPLAIHHGRQSRGNMAYCQETKARSSIVLAGSATETLSRTSACAVLA
jgi:hypothetical protein